MPKLPLVSNLGTKYRIEYNKNGGWLFSAYAYKQTGFWVFRTESRGEFIGGSDTFEGAKEHVKKHMECEAFTGSDS